MKRIKQVKREYLKLLRRQHQLSCPDVANALGLTHRQHYERYESGERDFGADFFDKYFSVFSELFAIKQEFLINEELNYLIAKYKNSNEFMIIKSFRISNPDATINDCSKATGITYARVEKFWDLVSRDTFYSEG